MLEKFKNLPDSYKLAIAIGLSVIIVFFVAYILVLLNNILKGSLA